MSILLLSFILIGSLLTSLVPVPFLDLIVSFIVVPLAHLVSWIDLFKINMIYHGILEVKNFPAYMAMASALRRELGLLWYFDIFVIVAYLLTYIALAGLTTVTQKLLYYLLQKRLKIVVRC